MKSGSEKSVPIAKITAPKPSEIIRRERLFRRLDEERKRSVVWISASAGSGKTALVTSYLQARKIPHLWYYVDAEDADIASFFYYMGKAAEKALPKKMKPLPTLTPEYLQGIPAFTRRYFEELFSRLIPRTTLPSSIPSHEGGKGFPLPLREKVRVRGGSSLSLTTIRKSPPVHGSTK